MTGTTIDPVCGMSVDPKSRGGERVSGADLLFLLQGLQANV